MKTLGKYAHVRSQLCFVHYYYRRLAPSTSCAAAATRVSDLDIYVWVTPDARSDCSQVSLCHSGLPNILSRLLTVIVTQQICKCSEGHQSSKFDCIVAEYYTYFLDNYPAVCELVLYFTFVTLVDT